MWDAGPIVSPRPRHLRVVSAGSQSRAFENHTFKGGGFSYGALKAARHHSVHQFAIEYMSEEEYAAIASRPDDLVQGGYRGISGKNHAGGLRANRTGTSRRAFGRPEEVAAAVSSPY